MNNGFVTYMIRTAKVAAPLIIGIIMIRTFVVEPSRVNGRSMESTFVDAQMIIVDKYSLLFFAPRRNNIVQFYDKRAEEHAVKRVIGLPGETITIRGGKVVITKPSGDYFILEEPYLDDGTYTLGYPNRVMTYTTIPENHYFLLGDHREESIDSRHFGTIPREDIRGIINKKAD